MNIGEVCAMVECDVGFPVHVCFEAFFCNFYTEGKGFPIVEWKVGLVCFLSSPVSDTRIPDTNPGARSWVEMESDFSIGRFLGLLEINGKPEIQKLIVNYLRHILVLRTLNLL